MTAAEGIAFASLVATIFATYLTYRTGKEARADAHALATEAAERAAADARAARLFDRRKDVYEEILEYAYRVEDGVRRTEPALTWMGMPGPPDWPSEDEVRQQNARSAAWGSPELIAKLIDLKKATQEFQGAVFILRTNRDAGVATVDEMTDVETKRETVTALVDDIQKAVNEELAR
jgi:hypothetical protein